MTARNSVRHRTKSPGSGVGPRLAAGWYIALPSAKLGAKPRALDLFGRQLVAWRDGAGRASIMSRHCPHLGASLAIGKVVDDQLRCSFHHWRFDATGACVEVHGVEQLPRGKAPQAYRVEERYDYIWVWYSGTEPAYPLPEVPALASERDKYLAYRFAHTTPASPRRILENAFDYYHFVTLHGVQCGEPPQLTMLPDPSAAVENGPPIAAEAWTGARLEFRGLQLPPAVRALGIRTERFDLLVDGWPSGQRLTFLLDGQVVVKELLGVTPVGDGHTIMQGWSLVRRTGNRARDAMTYLAYRAHHWWGTKEDLAIYRNASDAGTSVPVRYDHALLRFRKQYAEWVERAEA